MEGSMKFSQMGARPPARGSTLWRKITGQKGMLRFVAPAATDDVERGRNLAQTPSSARKLYFELRLDRRRPRATNRYSPFLAATPLDARAAVAG
jgi:hypothetical protein